jgi:hypothetical protein
MNEFVLNRLVKRRAPIADASCTKNRWRFTCRRRKGGAALGYRARRESWLLIEVMDRRGIGPRSERLDNRQRAPASRPIY